MVPPSMTGFSAAIFSRVVSRRGPSSTVTVAVRPRSPARSGPRRWPAPPAGASAARTPPWSCRVMPHFPAIISAPCELVRPAGRRTGPASPRCPRTGPRSARAARRPAGRRRRSGSCDMFWTPPATTRSWVPDSTACAAKCTACCEEPHCRSTVTPGTSSGSPAASQQVRAMSPACGPTVSRQPKTTSSTAAGSTPERATSAFSTCAPRSAGWTAVRPPPRRPTGVRTASTM